MEINLIEIFNECELKRNTRVLLLLQCTVCLLWAVLQKCFFKIDESGYKFGQDCARTHPQMYYFIRIVGKHVIVDPLWCFQESVGMVLERRLKLKALEKSKADRSGQILSILHFYPTDTHTHHPGADECGGLPIGAFISCQSGFIGFKWSLITTTLQSPTMAFSSMGSV